MATSTSESLNERLRRMREKRWSDPKQREQLAARNKARARHAHKPTDAQKFSISKAPAKAVEVAHTQTLNFLSELRLGLLTDAELATRFRESEARVRQLSRLAGPLAFNATGDMVQLRVDMLTLQSEIRRRKLRECQKESSHQTL